MVREHRGRGESRWEREERAQGGARVESERQKLPLFIPKVEGGTLVPVGANTYPRILGSSPCLPVQQPGA